MNTALELGPVTFDLRSLSKEHVETISEIMRHIKGASDQIVRAARKWVELPDDVRDKVIEGTPGTLRSIWDRLDKIGRGTLSPMLYASYGHNHNVLARLPLPEQEKYLTEKISVAIVNNGRNDIQRIDIDDLGPALRLQVFQIDRTGKASVRSVAQQRAWLVEQERKKHARAKLDAGITKIDRPGRWRIEKNRAFIDPSKLAAGLTLTEILQIAKDLKA